MRDGCSVSRGVRGALLVVAAFEMWGCASSPSAVSHPAVSETAPARAAPPECPDVATCFAAAKAAIDRGDATSARERLLAIREHWPAAPWPGRAALLLANLEQDANPASAIEWALQASTESSLLGDHALALAADAARTSGRSEQAATLLDTLAREHPDSSLAPTALWSAGELWQTIEARQGDAIADFMALAARFPQDARAATALARVVSAGESSGRLEDVGAACRTILVDYAASADAVSVQGRCERLMRSGAVPALTFEQRRRRAELLGRGAKFADALLVWKDLKRAAPNATVAREIELQTAVTMYRLRRWDDAWRAFRRVATSDAAPELREEARAWEGRAAFRRDDVRSLQRAETALAAAFPDSARRLELISLRAAWYRGQGQVKTALQAYQELARAANNLRRPDKIVEAYWNIGWIEYRRGHLAPAREALSAGLAAAAPADPQIPQLLYWSARFGELEAGSETVLDSARTLSDRFPYTYYGFLARRGSVTVGDASADAFGGAESVDASPADRVVQPDRALFPKAAELWLLGFQEDARDEVLAATRRAPPAPERAAEVAETLATVGADEEALRVVRRNFAPALERGDAALSAAIWRLAYPDHLLEPIKTRARDRVDPFLVSALIREESVYDPRALSPVGAIGLMQLMPDTGRRVARAEGLSDFSVDQLYRPEVNLTLGVRYLADLLERFAGNEAYAVAAYNAGPEAVTRWLENGPPRAIEEFIEEIPFAETRAYVKRVLRSAWLYHALYAPAEDRMVRAGTPPAAPDAD